MQDQTLMRLTCFGLKQAVIFFEGFLEAGKYVVDACDLLFAVWDGETAEGRGGTGDVVAYAQRKRRPIIHMNPCLEMIARI